MKNITIVGGCFTDQHNIDKEKLYHQTLKRKLLNNNNIDVVINIIRYERFAKCLEKILRSYKNKPIDLLLFHLRTEPVMRLSKLYYIYLDDKGSVNRSLNLPFFNLVNPEKYDLLITDRRIAPMDSSVAEETRLHHYLREMNYLAGYLIGNRKFSLKKYFELLMSIYLFCRENKMKLLIIGPVSRPHTFFENKLSDYLHLFFSQRLQKTKIPYIDCLGYYDKHDNYLFFENGIHVNKAGHDRIADMIYDRICVLDLLK